MVENGCHLITELMKLSSGLSKEIVQFVKRFHVKCSCEFDIVACSNFRPRLTSLRTLNCFLFNLPKFKSLLLELRLIDMGCLCLNYSLTFRAPDKMNIFVKYCILMPGP